MPHLTICNWVFSHLLMVWAALDLQGFLKLVIKWHAVVAVTPAVCSSWIRTSLALVGRPNAVPLVPPRW